MRDKKPDTISQSDAIEKFNFGVKKHNFRWPYNTNKKVNENCKISTLNGTIVRVDCKMLLPARNKI